MVFADALVTRVVMVSFRLSQPRREVKIFCYGTRHANGKMAVRVPAGSTLCSPGYIAGYVVTAPPEKELIISLQSNVRILFAAPAILGPSTRLNQAALAGLARKARTPSMK